MIQKPTMEWTGVARRTIQLHPFSVTVLVAVLIALPVHAGDVLINEIRIDQPGTDVDEYFELAGSPGASLDGLTYLVIGDGVGGSGVIDNSSVIDLTGQVIPETGFFVVAEATFTLGTADLTTTLQFENSDNVTHFLVTGFTGAAGDDLDTDDDGVLDVTPWSSIVDLIAVVEEKNPPSATEFHYGPPSIGPDGVFAPTHVYRCVADGAWTIGAFDPSDGTDTPGAVNLECPTPCPWDLSGNDIVGFPDLVAVLSNWGSCPGCPEDFDGNDEVGSDDLLAVLSNWGACP